MKFALVFDEKVVEYREYDEQPECKVIGGRNTIRPVEELARPLYNALTHTVEKTETVMPTKVVIGWNVVARPAADALDGIKSLAQAALDDSDRVAIRCAKAGVLYPVSWLAYDDLLRAIMRATVDGGFPTELPPRPDYPLGT